MKAVITRGKRKGEEITLGQYCNNWFGEPKNPHVIHSPLSLAFSAEGIAEIENAYKTGKAGVMLDEFTFKGINRNLYQKGANYSEHFEWGMKRKGKYDR